MTRGQLFDPAHQQVVISWQFCSSLHKSVQDIRRLHDSITKSEIRLPGVRSTYMDTFMLRLGAHYGPTVVSTEVQEQNLTWVQTGLFLPIKPFKFHCHSKKEMVLYPAMESLPRARSSLSSTLFRTQADNWTKAHNTWFLLTSYTSSG